MSRITVSDLNRVSFYQIPKSFYHNPEYIVMSSEAKLAYALLYDLLDLSAQNDWVNEEGEVYIKLSREKLMLRLNIGSKTTATKVMKELIKKELIEERRVGVNKCNEIYVCTPKELSKIYKDDDLLVFKEENKTVKNKKTSSKVSNTNGSTENGLQEVQKMDVQKMDFKKYRKWTNTNTKITKTKFSSSSSSKEIDIELEKVITIFIEVFKKEPTTNMKVKLKELITKTNTNFVLAMLEYAANRDAKYPSYFFKTTKEYIKNGIDTVEALEVSITEYYESKNKVDSSKTKKVSKSIKNKKNSKGTNNFTQRDDYNYEELEEGLSGIAGNDVIPSQSEIEKMLEKLKS
ncbi:hypothetical protein FHH43_01575 [Clostridium perfringens]|nr:hypothetical protein [Clostridium perfringens]